MTDPRPFGTHAPKGFSHWAIERTRRLPATWITRRLVHVLRHVAIRSLKGAPVDVEALGARMRLYPYNNVCEKKVLFTPQYFDPEERGILETRISDGFTFIDIGANVGTYSLFVAARAGPSARILAVEPQPEIFDRLTFNIRQNPFGTIKAVAWAVADKAGELTLFLDPRNSGESSVKMVGSEQAKSIRVPAISLAGLLEQEGFTRVDAIKVDVEGAEDLILGPFLRDADAERYPSLIFVRDGRGQWQINLPELLQAKGYRLLKRTRMNLVYERS